MYVKIDWHQTAAELCALYQHEVDGKLRVRYHALWLLRAAHHTIDEIAALLGVHPSTIIRWIQWYRTDGLAGVRAHRLGEAGGVTARLTSEQQAHLVEHTTTAQLRSIAEVRAWVEDAYGVCYTYWGMRSLLDRLDCHAVMPRPIAPQADPAIQDLWKKGA